MDLDALFRGLVIAQFTALAGIRLHYKWVTGTMASPPQIQAEGWFIVLTRMALTLALIALVALYIAGHHEADRFAVTLPAWLRLIGVPLALGALLLLVAAHRALGAYFSPTLRLRADHRLVETGPYRFIRHPIYAAYLLFFASSGLLSANAGIGGLGIAVILILITLRLPREERLLADRFGEAWNRYVLSTGRFLPRRSRSAVRTAGSHRAAGQAPGDPCMGPLSELVVGTGLGGDLPPVLPSPTSPEPESGNPCRAATR